MLYQPRTAIAYRYRLRLHQLTSIIRNHKSPMPQQRNQKAPSERQRREQNRESRKHSSIFRGGTPVATNVFIMESGAIRRRRGFDTDRTSRPCHALARFTRVRTWSNPIRPGALTQLYGALHTVRNAPHAREFSIYSSHGANFARTMSSHMEKRRLVS